MHCVFSCIYNPFRPQICRRWISVYQKVQENRYMFKITELESYEKPRINNSEKRIESGETAPEIIC